MILPLQDPAAAAPLFAGRQEGMVCACLQRVMGAVYTEAELAADPPAAAAVVGDFTFLAGRPTPALVRFWPAGAKPGFRILIPQGAGWSALIEECWPGSAVRVTRYATEKDPGAFSREELARLAAPLPAGFALHTGGRQVYDCCLAEGWSRDLVSTFPDHGSWEKLAAGAFLFWHGRLVCGAAAYARWLQGIEIEIDTHPDWRRRGLATLCAARLILDCLDRGLYPSWDAQNPASAALAAKLGYRPAAPYTAYELHR